MGLEIKENTSHDTREMEMRHALTVVLNDLRAGRLLALAIVTVHDDAAPGNAGVSAFMATSESRIEPMRAGLKQLSDQLEIGAAQAATFVSKRP